MSSGFATEFSFGIGLHKCGTSWLYNMLELHPNIHLFQRDTHFLFKDELYNQGIEKYYKQTKQLNNKKLAIEMSNLYLSSPIALERIKLHFPDSKLFVCIRNPIDRAFSHYLQDIKTSKLDRKTRFEDAIDNDDSILQLAKYKTKFKDLFKLFSKDKVHIILFDDIKNNPMKVLNDLSNFLEIPSFKIESRTLIKQINKARIPWSPALERTLNHYYHNISRYSLGRQLIRINRLLGLSNIIKSLNNSGDELPRMSKETRLSLKQYYHEDIQYVAKLTSRKDLNWQ